MVNEAPSPVEVSPARPDVGRRLVVHVPGYDPMTAEAVYGRFTREARRFQSTWKVSTEIGSLSTDQDFARWEVTTSGADWTVVSEVRWLRWEDVMGQLSRLSFPRRLVRGLSALADFVLGGVLPKYVRHNWRYAIFFLYPLLLVGMALVLGGAIYWLLSTWSGYSLLGLVGAVTASFGALLWARHRARLDHLLDDWIFASDYVRRPDPVLDARLDTLADELVAADRSGAFDEILVIGHSLGAVLAVDAVDRALARDPDFGSRGRDVSLATVGSSIPKLGFHRGAQRLRDALGRVGDSAALVWVDYQANADVMNFHKLHPVRGLQAGTRGPLVRTVPLRRVLKPEYYRKIRRNLLRVHNQFVSGNDVRSSYDYFMLVCGPCTVEVTAHLKDGASACVDETGARLRAVGEPFVPRRGLDRLP